MIGSAKKWLLSPANRYNTFGRPAPRRNRPGGAPHPADGRAVLETIVILYSPPAAALRQPYRRKLFLRNCFGLIPAGRARFGTVAASVSSVPSYSSRKKGGRHVGAHQKDRRANPRRRRDHDHDRPHQGPLGPHRSRRPARRCRPPERIGDGPHVAATIPRSAATAIRSSSSSVIASGGISTITSPNGRSQTPSPRACSQTRIPRRSSHA